MSGDKNKSVGFELEKPQDDNPETGKQPGTENDKRKREFKKEVAAKYDWAQHEPGPVVWKGKEFDTRDIDLLRAEQLVKEGFPFIKEKGKS